MSSLFSGIIIDWRIACLEYLLTLDDIHRQYLIES